MSGHGQGDNGEDRRKMTLDELRHEIQELQEGFSRREREKKEGVKLFTTAQAQSWNSRKKNLEEPTKQPEEPVINESPSPPYSTPPVVDASVVDASVVDASVVDASVVDASVVDASVVDAPVVESSEEFIRTTSTSELDLYRPSEEIDKLVGNIDDHLQDFLEEALSEFRIKSRERRSWSTKIWVFTICLVVGTFLLIGGNFYVSNFWISKPIITEKLLYIFVGGMFAQILSLMLIIMKYVFSPSKDVYSYLTELVKVRKLKNGYDNSTEGNNAP